jgi:hypothetical protein
MNIGNIFAHPIPLNENMQKDNAGVSVVIVGLSKVYLFLILSLFIQIL